MNTNEKPRRFSGWNAALSPLFAAAAIVGVLAVTQPEAAKGIIEGAIEVLTGEVFKSAPNP